MLENLAIRISRKGVHFSDIDVSKLMATSTLRIIDLDVNIKQNSSEHRLVLKYCCYIFFLSNEIDIRATYMLLGPIGWYSLVIPR